jgi:hypothetical protein
MTPLLLIPLYLGYRIELLACVYGYEAFRGGGRDFVEGFLGGLRDDI